MARVTVEDCIDKVDSPYELVLVAKERAVQLNSGLEPTLDRDNDKNTVIALREIADSTISIEDMKENLIQEYQTVTISDEEENLEMETSDNIDENDSFSNASQAIEGEMIDIETSDNIDENDSFSNASQEIEEEMIDLVKSEDSKIEEQYEVTESVENSDIKKNEDIQKESEL